ncbi:hypothetical protein V8E55_006997 [Tylopilus felleus]
MAPQYCDSSIHSHWKLVFTDHVAKYMAAHFRTSLGHSVQVPEERCDYTLSLKGLCEADWMVNQLLSVYCNKVVIHDANMLWLAERAGNYMTSHLEVVDPTQLQEDFPNATELDFHSDPAVIVDQSDNIALWYLLTTVSGPNQALECLMWENMLRLEGVLLQSLSPTKGWTVQARNVCPPETEPARYRMRGWLAATREQAAILSSAVAIMHPEIYCTGREALVRLRQWAAWENCPNICEVLMVWPSIYNVASIMVNQASPIHANHFGGPQWMDLLVTFSNYTDLHFIIPSIHSRFLYEPGTVIALSG